MKWQDKLNEADLTHIEQMSGGKTLKGWEEAREKSELHRERCIICLEIERKLRI